MTTLCQLIHGDPGVGKSWLGQSTPAPRLVLDAEGGSRIPWRMVDGKATRQKLITWDPAKTEPPPAPVDGEWEVCYVAVQDFHTMSLVFDWLNTGRHPFRSVVIDSLTEVQKRCKDQVAGLATLSDREWGDLLIKMEHLVRYYRDLVFHPQHPIECVTFLALTEEKKGIMKPAIQGALSISLPGYVDLEGYLFVEETADGPVRKLLITPFTSANPPHTQYQAKDRTHVLTVKYGSFVSNPDIEEMLKIKEEGETNG
jgi:hypothetical protein